MKILYLTGIPAPYRVDLFNCIGKRHQLTVVFLAEYQSDRNSKWQSIQPESFNAVFMNRGALNGKKLDFSMVNYLAKNAKDYDVIVVHGISFIASLLAIKWMNNHNIKYGLEADGAIIPNKESSIKRYIKKYCISNASFFLSSGKQTTDYFVHYGADEKKCYLYPFTSLCLADIYRTILFSSDEKNAIKSSLGIKDSKVIISVLNHLSGSDKKALIEVAKYITPSTAIYIICAGSEEAYNLDSQLEGIPNVNFLYDVEPTTRYLYFAAADMYFQFSKDITDDYEDVEASLFALPVISYDLIKEKLRFDNNWINEHSSNCSKNDGDNSNVELIINDVGIQKSFGVESVKKIVSRCVDDASNTEFRNRCGRIIRQIMVIKKNNARKNANLEPDAKVVLFIGQFIYRKGIDILLESVSRIKSSDIEFILIGGNPTEEYKRIVEMKKLSNVKFIPFLEKKDLRQFFYSADLFVLPTREDIWGLVINEAMAYFLPIITTDRCVAGCALLPPEDIVPVNNVDLLQASIIEHLNRDVNDGWYIDCILNSINYSIENSADMHCQVFEELQ